MINTIVLLLDNSVSSASISNTEIPHTTCLVELITDVVINSSCELSPSWGCNLELKSYKTSSQTLFDGAVYTINLIWQLCEKCRVVDSSVSRRDMRMSLM